ncbi:hypothetical protein GPECTOR_41g672 [Gonium pectorale]|uniref:Probable ubiquitin carboxyl-terminal hydrolase MINDY-4 n=1 Tax=Gonium pectorale TaxID=33097 RepID=A0A150GA58_GONPE|nr:hypothetical protein GPECTOR_41g672 [Gonium pectorale]|eukprot:KXZ46708.1 hypothetical protein GPECTOR_41g672 [Gonium pectorale]
MNVNQADVVEALVREYLVRANCSAALEAYNREKPKHGSSITKREVLRKALGLDKAAAYYKKQNPTADGIPSTLEVWVNYQMARVNAEAPSQATPAPPPQPTQHRIQRELGALHRVGAFLGWTTRAAAAGLRGSPRRAEARCDGGADAAHGGSGQALSSAPADSLVMEDIGDEHFLDDGGVAAPTAAIGAMRISAPITRKSGSSIPPDTMRQLRALLWGDQGQPPPSWKQGFFFNRAPGLQFGLLQRNGGPCGVLAALQAHVLVALHSPVTGFNISPRSTEQQAALVAAVTETLWQARPGPSAPAVLVLPEGEAGVSAAKLGYDALSRTVAMHSATTKEALADLVRGALAVLMAEEGWGVVLYVMSLALSRGIAAVRSDMDEPANGLLAKFCYCTQELVNLVMLGTATTNVFDGTKQLDGTTTLRGVNRRGKVGLLTLFEWYQYIEVGNNLKNPSLPVWVVCSESHFTVLFSLDSRPLGSQLPFDLYYYDELANQEALIKLSVSKDPKGGWTGRIGSTIGERGKCEGQNIPPLECVIETRWPGVKVDWNGTDPIL